MKAGMAVKKLALAVGLSATMATAANAALIGTWDYTQEFEWIEPIAPASVVKEGSTTGASDVDGYTKLSWGQGWPDPAVNKNSSLVVNPLAGDSTTPSGDLTAGTATTATDIDAMIFALGPEVVHNNFVITGTALDSTTAQDYVILTPGGGGSDQIQNIVFSVDFLETDNALTGAACPSGIENEFGCGDIFALSGGLLGIPTTVNVDEIAFLIDSFVRDDYLYEVFLREATGSLGLLPDSACDAVGAGDDCIGFVTDENLANRFQFEFAILATERQIPEPATLGLLAGGLIAAGWGRRRKSGKKRA